MSTSERGPRPATSSEGQSRLLRVLCVDDNRDVADSTTMLLRAVGFEARSCYDGDAALTIAETFQPSVCLLDLQMPRMCGDELAVELRNRATWRPLLLVAMTAMSNEQSSERIQKAGFHLHLVKPVSLHQLALVVDSLFRLAESEGTSSGQEAGEDVRRPH